MNKLEHITWYFLILSNVYAAGPNTGFNLVMQLLYLACAVLVPWLGAREP